MTLTPQHDLAVTMPNLCAAILLDADFFGGLSINLRVVSLDMLTSRHTCVGTLIGVFAYFFSLYLASKRMVVCLALGTDSLQCDGCSVVAQIAYSVWHGCWVPCMIGFSYWLTSSNPYIGYLLMGL